MFESFLSSYTPPASRFDEMIDGGRQPRPHWEGFLSLVANTEPETLDRWSQFVNDAIASDGVSYNVYAHPKGASRPWELDLLPLILPASEWRTIAAAVAQRARLLDAVLGDLYGPQRLLAEGLLPPALVFGQRSFLWPAHGIAPPGGVAMHVYAADLARSPDGSWWVLADRTGGPSGAGYALQNRMTISRALPDAFRDLHVEQLAPFFSALQDTLYRSAPTDGEPPLAVLLTPGPYNETYFEHAYLARYLGYTLVEGGDLTVRDNRVFLKVLGGLQPVDVIFRRLDDDFCDPLELRPDSFLGVPGLVHAVRAGNVAVANALGSGAAEASALLAYLPRLCRELLGEDLRIPNVQTWWCGDPVSLRHVLSRPTEYVFKPAFPGMRMEPVFVGMLDEDRREAFLDRVRTRPRDYVAQEKLSLSATPALVGDKLVPRTAVLRAYLAADGESFTVMPGGLTRVGAAADSMIVSMQRGAGSKDTWVLSAGTVSNFSLLAPSGLPVELSRAGGDLPSRAADNLFWLGRYAERAEATTRLLRGVVYRLTDNSSLADVPELPPLLRALTIVCDSYPGFLGDGCTARMRDPEPEVLALIYETSRHGSLASVLLGLQRVAGIARDRISTDMWRVIYGLASFPADAHRTDRPTLGDVPATGPDGPTPADVLDLLNRTVISLAAFGGLAVESMTRGEGWRFLDMGRRLERAIHMIGLLRGTLVNPSPNEGPVLEAVLEVADSSMTYRRRYMGTLRAEAVLDLLVSDDTNPRSLAAQLSELVEDVDKLPRPTQGPARRPEQRLALTGLNAVQLADVEKLGQVHAGSRPYLRDLFDQLGVVLPALSDVITQHYLSHLQTSRHLAASFPAITVPRPFDL